MSDDQNLPTSLAAVGSRDTRLIQRAIKQGWPIPQEFREALVARQIAIATSEECSPRESTSAFRSLLHANAQNIAVENRPLRKLKPLTPETVVVPGNLEQSKRNLWRYGQQLGLIPLDAQFVPSEAATTDDA